MTTLTRAQIQRVQMEPTGRNTGLNRVLYPFAEDRTWWRRISLVDRTILIDQNTLAIGDRKDHDYRTLLDRMGRDKPEFEQIRARLLADFTHDISIYDPTVDGEASRPYIPGLMNHGRIPAFVAGKGWGKTSMLAQVCADGIIPGYRLFGLLEPAEMTAEERQRDVWLINAETPPDAMHNALVKAGLVPDYRDGDLVYRAEDASVNDSGVLVVYHLTKIGGPQVFDLTDEMTALTWEEHLGQRRRKPPLTVIVDGVTAILENDTGRTALFASRLRSFLREFDVPNGLCVLHSPMSPSVVTPMGGLESMAEFDGVWVGRAGQVLLGPTDARYFRTYPRLGDPAFPEHRIVMNDDGLLEAREPRKRTGEAEADERNDQAEAEEYVLRVLAEADEPMWTKDVCGSGDLYYSNKAALEVLEERGEVIREGSGRRFKWRLSAGSEPDSEAE